MSRHLALVEGSGPHGGTDVAPGGGPATMGGIGRVRRLLTAGAPASGDPVANALRDAGRGDEEAFAAFYDHVAAAVHGIVVRVVRDPAMSEEVTQEVFVELWRLAPRFDPERGSARSWAATVAHRRAVDRVRSEQSSRDRELAESLKADRPRDDVVDEVVDRLDRFRVAEALGGLTDGQREAVVMAYYGGHTYREVAVMLGVPEGTVKTRIRDGLIKLRDLMGVGS